MSTNGGHAPTAPNLPLAQLYERTGRNGRRYLVGRIGQLKLLVVATDEVSKGERVWQAFVTGSRYHAPATVIASVEGLDHDSADVANGAGVRNAGDATVRS